MNQGQLANGLVLGALGIAALVVSGFSIFTTFLATVAERVRSIGLAPHAGGHPLADRAGDRGRSRHPFRHRRFDRGGALFSRATGCPATAPFFASTSRRRRFCHHDRRLFLLATGIGALAALYPGWTVVRMSPAEAFYEE